MKTYRRLLALGLASCLWTLGTCPAQAQRHFYRRIELGTANAMSGLAAIGLSTLINSAAKTSLVEAQMRFSSVSPDNCELATYEGVFDDKTINDRLNTYETYYSKGEDMRVSGSEYWDLDGRHLFNHVMVGAKMGYLTDYLSSTNWGIFGTVHYNYRKLKQPLEGLSHNIGRLQIGGGLMMTFGSLESETRVIVDAGIRYNSPISYSNNLHRKENDALNSGITSHYGIRYSTSDGFVFGFQFDMMHYNLFKKDRVAGEKNRLDEGAIVLLFLF